jgi:L-fucose isomerase-like protein
MKKQNITLGVIIGNRDFFPDKLVSEARVEILKVLEEQGIKTVLLGENDSKLGGVETYQDSRKCADLFIKHKDEISGVLVVLPNFGDERGVADTLHLANLKVPVLIQGYPDELNKLNVANRRDSWCGKISVCNNLYQYGIKYTITTKHVVLPSDLSFVKDLDQFSAVCRVVRGMKNVRIGAIGARPTAFNTVRYSEKILQRNGITVVTCDLSEILGDANKLDNSDQKVKDQLEKIHNYASSGKTPSEAMLQIAKLDIVLNDFMQANELDANAIQCWTSLQQNYGCNVCTSMSMFSEGMIPSACEVDVTGTLSMYALTIGFWLSKCPG